MDSRAAVSALLDATKDEKSAVRAAAAISLGRIGDASAVVQLIELTKDMKPSVRQCAWMALGLIGDGEAKKFLLAPREYRPHDLLAWIVAIGLLDQADEQTLTRLSRLLKSEHSEGSYVPAMVLWAIRMHKPKQMRNLMREALEESRSPHVASEAIMALGETGDERDEKLLWHLYQNKWAGPKAGVMVRRATGKQWGMVYSGGGTGDNLTAKRLPQDVRLGAALALGSYNTKQARDRLDDLIFTSEQINTGQKYTYVRHKENSPYTGNDMGQHIFHSSHRIDPIYGRHAMFSLGQIGHIDDLPLLAEMTRVWRREWSSKQHESLRTTRQSKFLLQREDPEMWYPYKIMDRTFKMKEPEQVVPQNTNYKHRLHPDRMAAALAMGLAMRKLWQEQQADDEVMSSLPDDEHDFQRNNAINDRRRALNSAAKLLIKHMKATREPAEFRAAVALAMGLSGIKAFAPTLRNVDSSKQGDDAILVGYVSLALAMLEEHQAAIKSAQLLLGKGRKSISPSDKKRWRFKPKSTTEQTLGHRAAAAGLGLVEDDKGKALKILYGSFGKSESVSWQVVESLRRRGEYKIAPVLIELLDIKELKSSDNPTPINARVAAAMSLGELYDQEQPSRLARLVLGDNYTFSRQGSLSQTDWVHHYRRYGNPFLYLVLMPLVR